MAWLRNAERTALALVVAVAGALGAVPAGPAAARELAAASAVGILKAVDCPTTAACVAVGGSTVVTTTDRGAHWTLVASPPDVFDLTAVTCGTPTRCLVAGSRDGDAGAVYRTSDGGRTWRLLPAELPGGLFLAISCATRLSCVVTGNEGAVLSTADGGRSWHARFLPDATLVNGIDCVTTTVCEAVAYSGHDGALGVALRTVDGGQSWVTQPLPRTVPFPTGLDCPSVSRCVAVGQDTISGGRVQVGVIAATTDGGTTWRRQRAPDGYTYLSGVACPAIGVCEAVGYGPQAMIGTVNRGRTWAPQGPRIAFLRGISCPSLSTCVAVGETDTARGAIYRTSNRGNTWQRQPIG